MSDSAAKNGDQPKAPLTRAQKKKLKKTRAEAKDFLREAKRLAKRYGKRIAPEKLAQVQEAIAALEAARPGEDVERLVIEDVREDGRGDCVEDRRHCGAPDLGRVTEPRRRRPGLSPLERFVAEAHQELDHLLLGGPRGLAAT